LEDRGGKILSQEGDREGKVELHGKKKEKEVAKCNRKKKQEKIDRGQGGRAAIDCKNQGKKTETEERCSCEKRPLGKNRKPPAKSRRKLRKKKQHARRPMD